MNASKSKGNNPELWEKFLDVLDEKLQLGLLDHLRKVASYHFEEDILYIEPGGAESERYFAKPAVHQQLEILAQDAVGVEKVKVKKLES
jgi:hypothetical protein